MKRRELMKKLASIAKRDGLTMQTEEGGRHTRVSIGDRVDFVPRHAEINELTAQAILKRLGGK